MPPIRGDEGLGFDALFGALCFARSGTWASYERIASQVNDAPWFSIESARTLSSLAHLEVEIEPRSARPLRWAIAPPTLATLPGPEPATAVFCGWRSDELAGRLTEDVKSLGGDVEATPSAGPRKRCLFGALIWRA